MTEFQEDRLKDRDLAAEERKFHGMEPATYNYMHEVPSWMKYDPMFNAIWTEIKTWDVNVPTEYAGYCGASGSHVAAILAAIIDKGLYVPGSMGDLGNALPELRV